LLDDLVTLSRERPGRVFEAWLRSQCQVLAKVIQYTIRRIRPGARMSDSKILLLILSWLARREPGQIYLIWGAL